MKCDIPCVCATSFTASYDTSNVKLQPKRKPITLNLVFDTSRCKDFNTPHVNIPSIGANCTCLVGKRKV